MKVKDYKELFAQLDTTEEMDARILDSIKNKYNEKSNIHTHRVGKKYITVAAVICIIVATATVGATIKTDLFKNMFGKKISQYSEEAVYVDENEHGKITVEEVITDRMNTYLIFSYEMYDERCREWMDDYFVKGGIDIIDLHPIFKDGNSTNYGGVMHSMKYTADQVNLSKYETDNKKYFMISIHTDSDLYGGTNEVEFQYLLPGRGYIETTNLEITKEVPLIVYNLDSGYIDNTLESVGLNNVKNYEPLKVKLSTFGICIEGKSLVDRDMYYNSTDNREWEVDTLYLETKNGSMINLLDSDIAIGGSSGFYSKVQAYDDIDYVVGAYNFVENIDVDEIVGIRINRTYYKFY